MRQNDVITACIHLSEDCLCKKTSLINDFIKTYHSTNQNKCQPPFSVTKVAELNIMVIGSQHTLPQNTKGGSGWQAKTMEYNMSELKEGQSAKVLSVNSLGGMRRRLFDLGLIEGTVIECLQKSSAGDPIAYKIRGAVIALRKDDLMKISVLAN